MMRPFFVLILLAASVAVPEAADAETTSQLRGRDAGGNQAGAGAGPGTVLRAGTRASRAPSYFPTVADFIGSNGFPGRVGFFAHDTTHLWEEMGLRFFRHDVLWGEVEQTQDSFDFSPTTPDALDHDLILSTAAAEGFEALVILAYTAPWASTGPTAGTRFRERYESYFPPADPADWLDYVERTVSRYTQPPYNVRYFEVWNEPFAEYWEGTREEYVDDILIPAAQVIHNHGAQVVAPAWSGAETDVLEDWLSYNDAWTHIDILSTHYGWGDGSNRDILYDHWIANGRIDGLWQTEVCGYEESNNPFFIAQNYPRTMDWYLRHNWNSPDKYKYLYWTDGVTLSTGEFLINQNASSVFLTDQGRAMRTFTDVFAGEIRLFAGTVDAPPGAAVFAFETETKVMLALEGVAAGGQIVVTGLPFPVGRVFAVDVVDAMESELSFVQADEQVSITLPPTGNDYVYVTWTFCGDGVLASPEQCDDGNSIDGDGCDSNCTATACGNGIATGSEQCDDDNTVAGDCCDPACLFEPAGSACEDGDLCTTMDVCDEGGTCAGEERPLATCGTAGKAMLRIRDGDPDLRDSLTLKLIRGDASLVELGDPITGGTRYQVCVYDRAASVASLVLASRLRAGGKCAGRDCWRALGQKGYRYRDPDLLPDGLFRAVFKAGVGQAKWIVKGRGNLLALPALPLALDPNVTVQVRSSAGGCWGASFTAATRNDDAQFKAKSP